MTFEELMETHAMRRFIVILIAMGGIVAAVGLVLKLLSIEGASNLMIVGFSTLAVSTLFLNVLFPYKVKDDNMAFNMEMEPIWNFSMRITGMSLTTLLIGVLFRLMHWPSAKTLLLIGAVALGASGIAWIYYRILRNHF